MRYCPCPSVTTERTFSISAGLDASTVTPGSTAPEESLTRPAMAPVACAEARAGKRSTQNRRAEIATLTNLDIPIPFLDPPNRWAQHPSGGRGYTARFSRNTGGNQYLELRRPEDVAAG